MSTPKTHRILIIDDNPAIHEDFKKVFIESGPSGNLVRQLESSIFGDTSQFKKRQTFELESAFQGKEGLEKIQAALQGDSPFAMAFVDVRMPPGWDGIETIERIWKVDPYLQVVVCTAYSDYSWDDMRRRIGTSDNLIVLKKPFDNIEVLQLAHALTCKWELARQNREKFGLLGSWDSDQGVRPEEMPVVSQPSAPPAPSLPGSGFSLRGELFDKLFRSLPIAVALQSRLMDRYIDANDAWLRLAGRTREEFSAAPNKGMDLWVTPEEGQDIQERVRRDGPLRDLRSRVRGEDGHAREVLVSTEVIQNGDEHYVLWVVHDVSDRVHLEARVRQSERMEMVALLAAGIAQNLNNLLTVIQGHCQLQLAAPDLPPRLRLSATTIAQATDRVATMTHQLLAFSRQQPIELRSIEIGELVKEVCDILRPELNPAIRLEVTRNTATPLKIDADLVGVEQVIRELVFNAQEAMPEGGSLTVSLSEEQREPDAAKQNPEARSGQFIRLAVSDTGCGLEPRAVQHVFEPFYVAKQNSAGAGLGLSMVYGIVKRHHGWVEVESVPGKGTTFAVYLPQGSGDSTPSDPSRSGAQPVGAKETILLVEGEPGLRELIQSILAPQGYQVLPAADGRSALELWKRHSNEIKLVLTEAVIPGELSSLQLIREVETKRPDVQILFTSVYSRELVQEWCGAIRKDSQFLPKPYRPQALQEAIRSCLDTPQSNQLSP